MSKKHDAFDFIWRKRRIDAPLVSYQHLKCIAYADNYVMVRARNAMPFVMSLKDWLALPPARMRTNDEN